ncbi:MAG TPA: MarR family transcriptional regulator [Thermoleophilaceae bacterium]|nr:MarR family transcriptional regulator [Thermoleophilaceae bacterium]
MADLSPRLRLAITRTARRLRQEADAGLSPSLTAALATLERHGPLTPSRLAEVERIQRPTVTRLVATLEEEGLVTREPDPDDRRVAHIRITKEGRALVKKLRSRKNAYLSRRLRDLDDEELETLERATAILERILEEPE